MIYGPCSMDLLSIARALFSLDSANSVAVYDVEVNETAPHHQDDDERFSLIRDVDDRLKHIIKTGGGKSETFIVIRKADHLSRELQYVLEFFTWVLYRYNILLILTFSKISRFNYSFSSRFSKFSFKALEQNELEEIVSHICAEQYPPLDPKDLTTIINVSNGTLRSAIKCFEEANKVSRDGVLKISNVHVSPELENAKAYIGLCTCDGTAECSMLESLLYTISKEEDDMFMFLNEVLDLAVKLKGVPNEVKDEVFKLVVEADQNMGEYNGLWVDDNVYFQMLELFYGIKNALSNCTESDAKNHLEHPKRCTKGRIDILGKRIRIVIVLIYIYIYTLGGGSNVQCTFADV